MLQIFHGISIGLRFENQRLCLFLEKMTYRIPCFLHFIRNYDTCILQFVKEASAAAAYFTPLEMFLEAPADAPSLQEESANVSCQIQRPQSADDAVASCLLLCGLHRLRTVSQA